MKKAAALSLFKSPAALASALGISRSAVSQWPADGEIPKAHALTIRFVLRPDAFDENGGIRADARDDADRVIAAAVRKRKPVPENWLDEPDSSNQRAA